MREEDMTYERLLALDEALPKKPKPARRANQGIATVTYRAIEGEEEEETCCICCDTLKHREKYKRIKNCHCKRIFMHAKCLSEWLKHDTSCPVCRFNLQDAG